MLVGAFKYPQKSNDRKKKGCSTIMSWVQPGNF